jgi:hypothetical protein
MTLRQLLTWADPAFAPDLAIVLVDADGDRARRTEMLKATEELTTPRIIAVAVQELEAWLLADHDVIRTVCNDPSFAMNEMLEELEPGVAKQRLDNMVSKGGDRLARRLSIAQACRLEELRRRCPSFGQFEQDLRHSSRA